MSSAKGYHSYRGRVSKWKVLLAVLLCLVILAAGAVIYLQEHMVYDENGVRRLEIPWLQEPEEPDPEQQTPPEEEPELDLVIQGPPGPAAIHAFSLPAEALTPTLWHETRNVVLLSSTVPYDAAAVTLKDAAGRVYYDSAAAMPGAVKAERDTAAALVEITGQSSGFHSIARIACLRDSVTARANVTELGLKNTGGYIFYDGNNQNWLDPAKEETVNYVSALVLEAADLGFDEILLTDLTYPTEGKLHKIAYTGSEDLSENIAALVRAVRAALGEREVLLSLELPEQVIASGPDETAGLDLNKLAPLADRIYAVTTASQAEGLKEKVTAVNETGDFIPELALESQAIQTERCLILHETPG